MRLRTLQATVVAGTLALGLASTAQAAPVLVPAKAGTVVAWGDTADADADAALTVPGDLTAPVAGIATNSRTTAVVTTDGQLRVWGQLGAAEADLAPAHVTDAAAVALSAQYGAVLHSDGQITAWGSGDDLAFSETVPSDLRAKAIAIGQGSIGYAVRADGTLARWGNPDALDYYAVPDSGLTDLVDVVANNYQVMALHADGTVVAWGALPEFEQENVPNFGGHKVTQITAGPTANGVILDDGTIEVWGSVPPTGEPDFAGHKVVSLSFNASGFSGNAGAVTDDGLVHIWGAGAVAQVSAVPTDLAGQPVAAIAMGAKHAAVIVTAFRDLSKPTVTGTPQVGQTLTGTPATFNLTPDVPATGQWYAGTEPITGQTGTTLTLDQTTLSKKISYRSIATRGGKTVTSTSNELGPVTAVPPATTPPVTKAHSKVTAKVKAKGKAKKIAKKVKITVTVKTTKGVSPAGKVTITLKGKTKKKVTAKVNAKGKATVTIKKVKRGKYKAHLAYAGNAKVKSSHSTKKFKV